jgi:serine-type D-Ala-D-Ala carboxypeptidase (penicillin-binding protein 5/6)
LPIHKKVPTRLASSFLHPILLSLFLLAETASASDPFPGIARSYLVKINGNEVWAHSPDLPLPPASLTKIMTGLIALEKLNIEETVAVSATASKETGSRIGLHPGDKLRVIDLLAAALVGSANDACHALAVQVAGSENKFVQIMNSRARELGLAKTHFTNACGHDNPQHYSTVRDLALLAETALKNPVFAEVVSLVQVDIHTKDRKRNFHFENKNELIGRYDGAVGVKTGFTAKAGKCLVALVERNGKKILLTLLNAPDRWWSATRILDAALAQPPHKDSR